MNIIEMIGAVATGIITIAIVALIFAPNSTAPRVIKNAGEAFSSSIKAATLKG